jgi:hypothetical protein
VSVTFVSANFMPLLACLQNLPPDQLLAADLPTAPARLGSSIITEWTAGDHIICGRTPLFPAAELPVSIVWFSDLRPAAKRL